MNNDTKEEKISIPVSPNKMRFLRMLCPYFCRYKKGEETVREEKKHIQDWALSGEQQTLIRKYLRIEEEEGFEGMLPYTLHNVWEDFMMPDLYELWITYIFGTMDDIVPNYRRFCDLVRGQWSAPFKVRAIAIISIILRKDYEEIEKMNLKINKDKVVKYFFNLTASYIRGMGYRNNPEFLMWVSCDADFKESNLRIAMAFISNILPDMVGDKDLLKIMEQFFFLRKVLSSVIEMSFGIAQVSNTMIPFPIAHGRTVLDIAQVVLLTSFVAEEERDLYEWEMLYSTEHQGFHAMSFAQCIVKKGPTIIVIKDQDGWMFGSYTSRSWRISSKFTGNNYSFLFRLVPTFKIFPASDADQNYMCLDIGSQKPLNFLALGGSIDYFGLWVNLDKPLGRCENFCSTFTDYECLSCTNNFHYISLEVWRVSKRELEKKGPRPKITSEA